MHSPRTGRRRGRQSLLGQWCGRRRHLPRVPCQVLISPELRKSYDRFGLVESRRFARQLSFERWQQHRPHADRSGVDSPNSLASPPLPPTRRYTVTHSPSRSSWTAEPTSKAPSLPRPPPLPTGWAVAYDVQGASYYCNLNNGKSTYERQRPPTMVTPPLSPRVDTAVATALETQALTTVAWLATKVPRSPLPQQLKSPRFPTRLKADCRQPSCARPLPTRQLVGRTSPPPSTEGLVSPKCSACSCPNG